MCRGFVDYSENGKQIHRQTDTHTQGFLQSPFQNKKRVDAGKYQSELKVKDDIETTILAIKSEVDGAITKIPWFLRQIPKSRDMMSQRAGSLGKSRSICFVMVPDELLQGLSIAGHAAMGIFYGGSTGLLFRHEHGSSA